MNWPNIKHTWTPVFLPNRFSSLYYIYTLREKCPYSELLWAECVKIRTRITPNKGTFYAMTKMISEFGRSLKLSTYATIRKKGSGKVSISIFLQRNFLSLTITQTSFSVKENSCSESKGLRSKFQITSVIHKDKSLHKCCSFWRHCHKASSDS